ncbi:hypothetical protein DFP72DRAFT_1150294 [Ephemerocybe angulata]|uniref:Uncharacterized protein n=1 Tax=Ephemerocybe angulata TaxID=980116 RepID=A0A8H6LY07_9AGAR|nr:hypothetical protein DFP72DRAFT_1150294 [Tulosesus angulatus]
MSWGDSDDAWPQSPFHLDPALQPMLQVAVTIRSTGGSARVVTDELKDRKDAGGGSTERVEDAHLPKAEAGREAYGRTQEDRTAQEMSCLREETEWETQGMQQCGSWPERLTEQEGGCFESSKELEKRDTTDRWIDGHRHVSNQVTSRGLQIAAACAVEGEQSSTVRLASNMDTGGSETRNERPRALERKRKFTHRVDMTKIDGEIARGNGDSHRHFPPGAGAPLRLLDGPDNPLPRTQKCRHRLGR